jgi:hypothetical protein
MATRSHSNTSGLTPWVGTMVHCATTRTRKIKTAMVFIEDCLVEFLLMLGGICLQVGEYIQYIHSWHMERNVKEDDIMVVILLKVTVC